MNDSTLLRIALCCSVIGLLGLSFILLTTHIQESNMATLQDEDVGSTVRIVGVVDKIILRDDITQIVVSQNSKVNAVIFEKINLSKGDNVDVIGKLDEYNGKKELLIEKIIVH